MKVLFWTLFLVVVGVCIPEGPRNRWGWPVLLLAWAFGGYLIGVH